MKLTLTNDWNIGVTLQWAKLEIDTKNSMYETQNFVYNPIIYDITPFSFNFLETMDSIPMNSAPARLAELQ